MKKVLFPTLATVLVFLIIAGCGSSGKMTKAPGDESTGKWFQEKAWLNGLQLNPDPSINQQEFSRQYHTNKVWWDKAFAFLKTEDLVNMKPGSYVLDSGNVIATVSELSPKAKDQVNWEAHRNFYDLQYIIKGKAIMGITPITDPGAKVTVPYTTRGDTETFSVAEGTYHDALPGSFFIFSPKEIHRPAFKADGYDVIKKVVIKVRVP